jgi:hypothetical protein
VIIIVIAIDIIIIDIIIGSISSILIIFFPITFVFLKIFLFRMVCRFLITFNFFF